MILMMVEATKSYIWFGGPYKALNHPKSSSRNPCGPNWSEEEKEEKELEEKKEEEMGGSQRRAEMV